MNTEEQVETPDHTAQRGWDAYRQRYQQNEWRARIFRDMILSDVKLFDSPPAILDIGCGSGFDNDLKVQEQIIEAAGDYVGVDPDAPERPGFHRNLFEDVALEPDSIDVAFAAMVLEHIPEPARFWSKLHSVLRSGGIFWGFTVDARHWFRHVSTLSERVGVKGLYLTMLRGERGIDRYSNYPTWYRANSPTDVQPLTGQFRSVEFINFQKVGQLDYYVPKFLSPISHAIDRAEMSLGRPGMILAIRAVK